jgi:hypothetical protein
VEESLSKMERTLNGKLVYKIWGGSDSKVKEQYRLALSNRIR